MKLLIATGVYPPESGGPATYTKLLEDKLPALGFEVGVLPFRVVRHLPPGVRHVVYVWKCITHARGAEVIYAQDTVSVGLPACLAALITGKKFVVRIPGDFAWEQGKNRFGVTETLDEFQDKKYGLRVEFLRSLQKFVVRHALKIVAPSDYSKRFVLKWGVPEEKVVRIYNSMELKIEVDAPANRPQGFLIVSSGRNVPWKGFEALREVVAREKNWNLFIAEELPRKEALGWVKSADVYVLNSWYEGLSHQLLETMALKTPIIATAVGGTPELITDQVEGLLIPPKDNEALYRALKAVEADREAAKKRAEAAHAKVQDFSIDLAVKKISALLNSL